MAPQLVGQFLVARLVVLVMVAVVAAMAGESRGPGWRLSVYRTGGDGCREGRAQAGIQVWHIELFVESIGEVT